jgi:DNA polymerase III subunit gamma/tau
VAYQSLYRKYRPQRFGEMVGQEHVTGALRNAVRDGRTGHAYLFSGPRGTGKTTTARILAKALNCLALGDDGDPCGECENCVSITAGTFLDLFELDAASHRGVEDIQDLIASAALGIGPNARTKVYVLDEIHMLSNHAANALLKTLEEAPAHVVFVLATTNPEKVLPTIRSRTQHFEFTLLSMDQLVARLADLCAREGVEADADALAVIAAAGAGSARDSESLLDQALAHGPGALDAGRVAGLFGGSPFALRVGVLEAIAGEDAAGGLIQLADLLEAGHDPRRVAEDLLAASRDAFLLTAGAGRVRVDAPDDERDRLETVGQTLGNAALVRVIETLGQAVTDMRGTEAADPRLVLEVALVRLSRRDAGPPLQTVVERIERLERAMADGAPAVAAPPPPAPVASSAARPPRRTLGAVRAGRASSGDEAPEPDAVPSEVAAPPTPPAPTPSVPAPPSDPGGPLEVDDVIIAWAAILPELPVATRSAVQNAHPLRLEGDVIVFGVAPNVIEAARPRFKKEADAIRAALAHHLGRSLRFNLEPSEALSLGNGSSEPPVPVTPGASSDGAEDAPSVEHDVGDDIDIDLSQVTDAPPDTGASPTVSLLEQHLGATVVHDVPRESG